MDMARVWELAQQRVDLMRKRDEARSTGEHEDANIYDRLAGDAESAMRKVMR